MKSPHTIPLAIIVGGVIIAGAVYLSAERLPGNASASKPELVRPVSSSDHILGNPAARVKIIEYADFDCSYCAGYHEALHQVVATLGASGEVAWVFRHFPLTEIHPNALRHAQAAECAVIAGGENAFWAMSGALFEAQPIDSARYGTYARAAGIEEESFASCLANGNDEIDARIALDRENALSMGARGTPYSVLLVEGKPPIAIEGARTYEALRVLIEDALD